MNPQIAIQIVQPVFYNSVSQLAKTHLPTLKANTTKDLKVGGITPNFLARSHAREISLKINVYNTFSHFKNKNWEATFAKSPNALHDFLKDMEHQLRDLFSVQEPEFIIPLKNVIAVADWNNFIRLVHFFTLINCKNRIEKDTNIFVSQPQDFLNAIKVLATNNHLKFNRNKHFNNLLQQFENTYAVNAFFTRKKIMSKFKISTSYAEMLIKYLKLQHRIENISIIKATNEMVFQLVK